MDTTYPSRLFVEEPEVREAVARCMDFLEPLLADYSRMYSVRGILIHLGYEPWQIEATIAYCAERGFDYCLDPAIAHNGVHPPWGPCQWNPDQLHSRLGCI